MNTSTAEAPSVTRNKFSDKFNVLSLLLSYPDAESLAELSEIRALAGSDAALLAPLFDWMEQTDLIQQQEFYVQCFDRTPGHSLHLFEHLHGEDRARGQALVNLLEEYEQFGLVTMSEELPDYLPLFLEFLAYCPAEKAQEMLDEAIHVIAHVGDKLQEKEVPYAAIFQVLQQSASVAPQALLSAPIRDMDEALEKFGPNIEGVEPLLGGACAAPGLAPIQFYPKRQQV